MKITCSQQGDNSVVQLEGEFDLEHAAQIRRELLACVARERDIAIDMSAVSYIDSSGVANLIEARQAALSNNQGFALVAPSPQTLKVLKLARLDSVFVIRPESSGIDSSGADSSGAGLSGSGAV